MKESNKFASRSVCSEIMKVGIWQKERYLKVISKNLLLLEEEKGSEKERMAII